MLSLVGFLLSDSLSPYSERLEFSPAKHPGCEVQGHLIEQSPFQRGRGIIIEPKYPNELLCVAKLSISLL